MIKKILPVLALVAVSISFILLYLQQTHNYLRFSDGAKYADIALNLVEDKGYLKRFNFFSSRAIVWPHNKLFEARNFPPLVPYSVAIMFKVWGISDFTVILASSIYFIGTVVMTYLLGRRLFNGTVGILSSLAVASNINLLDYATSGASETAFIFLILLAVYLIVRRNRYSLLSALVVLLLLYLTRPQAVVYILGVVFLMMLFKFGYKRSITLITIVSLAGLLVDRLIIYPLSIRYSNIMPLFERGLQAINVHLISESPSDILRGAATEASGTFVLIRKVFYNLFNFYRRIPDIMSPYLLFAFVLGIFIKSKEETVEKTKFMVLFVTVLTFLTAALTIPFFRYIHPIVPLVYIFGVGTFFIVSNRLKLSKIIPISLITFFVIVLSVLTMLVDVRFNRTIYNFGKPPVYTLLGEKLRLITHENDVIVTNLDTWGSWYGERKTVWLPLEPEKLIPSKDELTVDAIYITDYLMDDENYYLGEGWREILNAPEKISETVLGGKFEGYQVIQINAQDTYEKIPARGVLIWRKNGSK